jgi:hypothetical protein
MLAVVAIARLDGDAFRLTRGQRWTVLGVLAVANAAALFTNIRRYVTGNNAHGFNLDRNAQWWWHGPISPMAVFVVGVCAFTVALVVLTTDLTTKEPATGSVSPGGWSGRVHITDGAAEARSGLNGGSASISPAGEQVNTR